MRGAILRYSYGYYATTLAFGKAPQIRQVGEARESYITQKVCGERVGLTVNPGT